MDDEIQFGDVEEKRPDKALRPDRNAHFCCISMGAPSEVDLPIFVDLDALLDMEDHAKSDMRVELGGVMLGGHFEDDDGKPFVVVTDTLRAQHYESTKGSFKFTHDTWAEISRRRDAYPTTTHMVGWYHTHPDWGVFLSGMDLFICDHFFNKPLDVAYVIDPCRGHRGMFQWTEEADRKVRPTRGFYAIASRFRQNELAAYAALLEESAMSAELRRFTGQSSAPSIVHAIAPKDQLIMPLVLMMMMLQFGLLALLVWSTISGPRIDEAKKFNDLQSQIASLKTSVEENGSTTVQAELLDRVLEELKSTERGTAQKMLSTAKTEVAFKEALLSGEKARKSLENISLAQKATIEEMEKKLVDAQERLKSNKERIAQLDTDLKEATAAKSVGWKTVFSSPWTWGGMFAAAFIGAAIAMVPAAVKQRQEELESEKVVIEPRPMDS
jgi:proteasome lid subunit RPN8/RPN11